MDTDNTKNSEVASMHSSISGFDGLFTVETTSEEQTIMNLSRSLLEFPPSTSCASDEFEFCTPRLSDISLATRCSLPSTDDSILPESADDAQTLSSDECLPGMNLRNSIEVAPSYVETLTMGITSSESDISDSDSERTRNHYVHYVTVADTVSLTLKRGDSLISSGKQSDDVFVPLDSEIDIVIVDNQSGDNENNNELQCERAEPVKVTFGDIDGGNLDVNHNSDINNDETPSDHNGDNDERQPERAEPVKVPVGDIDGGNLDVNHNTDINNDATPSDNNGDNDERQPERAEPVKVPVGVNNNLHTERAEPVINPTIFRPNRRSFLAKQLSEEEFSTSPYKSKNMSGFVTDRPEAWIDAMLKYTKTYKDENRVQPKLNSQTNSYTEYKFFIMYKSNQLIVNVRLGTGYLSVKGIGFLDWIDNEFPLVQKFVEPKIDKIDEMHSPNGPTQDGELIIIDESQNVKSEHSQSESTQEDNMVKQNNPGLIAQSDAINDLWMDNQKMREQIKEIQSSVKNQSCNCKELTEELLKKLVDERLHELESKYDKKVTTFTEVIEKGFQNDIKNATEGLDTKLWNLRDHFIDLKTTYEDELNGVYYKVVELEKKIIRKPENSNGLQDSVVSIEIQLDEINSSLESLITGKSMDDSHKLDNTLTSQVNGIKENLDNHIKEMDVYKKKIDTLQQKLQFPPPNNMPNFPVSYPPIPPAPPMPPAPLMSQFHPPRPYLQANQHQLFSSSSITNNTSQYSNNADNSVSNQPIDNKTELLIVIDSNEKHINRRLFWSLEKTKWSRCGNINEINAAISNNKYTNLQYVLINVGVNDIDDEEGVNVALRLQGIINRIQELYPNIKIILSKITPRNDERDDQVVECNKALDNIYKSHPMVFLANQDNLRDNTYSFLFDAKHIKSSKIGRFAANLKIALRKAYGIVLNRNNAPRQQQRLDDRYENTQTWRNRNSTFNDHGAQQYQQYQPLTNNMEYALKMDFKRKLLALFE